MTHESPGATGTTESPEQVAQQLDTAIAALQAAHRDDPYAPIFEVLDAMVALMRQPGGLEALYERVPALEAAQVFAGSDWDYPATLSAELAWRTLRLGEREATLVEMLSQIRLLAVAQGDYEHPQISAEHAQRFLRRMMALNLDLVGNELGEADRNRPGGLGLLVRDHYHFLLQRLGTEHLAGELAREAWRMLAQQPVRVDTIAHMITRIAIARADPEVDTGADPDGRATRLVNALFTPSPGCADDPGIEQYTKRLDEMAYSDLIAEAQAMGALMRETGLVSAYQPALMQHLRGRHDDLQLTVLGLSSTGCDTLLCYRQLVYALIDEVITPRTPQAAHGLAMLLERGLLHVPGVAAGLWRQLRAPLHEGVGARLTMLFGEAGEPRMYLLADLLCMLGQPLGVGQGNHPTCQSARALSMWAYADPRRLLELLHEVARDDDLVMRFEGESLTSSELPPGLAEGMIADTDAVSVAMVGHLDRIYWEMGRRCAQRGGDPHQWVNPEFHGDGVWRGFRIAVNVATGNIEALDTFIRDFYGACHPYYNGEAPLVHPQPAGIAATDSLGRFLGWHAISIQRLALDETGTMRVYFFNPNNDSAQDWGQGIVTATHGHGEWPGESSLPVAQFAARLYAFHYDPRAHGGGDAVPREEVDEICCQVRKSWGAGR